MTGRSLTGLATILLASALIGAALTPLVIAAAETMDDLID